ncbi:MAG: 3'(2'),5'-bisphosphate nucleotidase CysQ family protein [Alphaproteobacteria bacterium]
MRRYSTFAQLKEKDLRLKSRRGLFGRNVVNAEKQIATVSTDTAHTPLPQNENEWVRKSRALKKMSKSLDDQHKAVPVDRVVIAENMRKIALAAGQELMKYHGKEMPTRARKNGSLETVASKTVEGQIIKGLVAAYPTIPIVAEGLVEAGVIKTAPGELFFLVDPLDGLEEFMKGGVEFTLNIALIEKGKPIIGVVHVPALARTYVGSGLGTAQVYLAGQKEPKSIAARYKAGMPYVVVSKSQKDNARLKLYLSTIDVAKLQYVSSSLKFCMIADGQDLDEGETPYPYRLADYYIHFGKTMEWNIAAGHAILRSSYGSIVTRAEKEHMLYGKPKFENPGFVAIGMVEEEADEMGQWDDRGENEPTSRLAGFTDRGDTYSQDGWQEVRVVYVPSFCRFYGRGETNWEFQVGSVLQSKYHLSPWRPTRAL